MNVKNFVDGVEALAQGGGDETVPLLLLEVSQICSPEPSSAPAAT